MRLIDGDSINFESNEFDTYNDYSTAFDAIDKAPIIDLWKYPSRGELPEKDGEYLITVKIEGGGFINAFALYVDRRWLGMFNKPYAWQYIEPPQDIT